VPTDSREGVVEKRRLADQAGFTLIEVLIVATLSLIIAIAMYDFMDASNRSFTRETDIVSAQNEGRVALDIFAEDLRHSGFTPLGVGFHAVFDGDTNSLRLQSDIDGDGDVTSASEDDDEHLSYRFVDSDGDGLFELERGVDLNYDWDFDDTNESSDIVASNIVPIDVDGDGTDEPFLEYVIAPDASTVAYDWEDAVTSRVTISFGVRAQHRDIKRRAYPVSRYHTRVTLRNRMNEPF